MTARSMLQRSLQRSLRPSTINSNLQPCINCTCRCGITFTRRREPQRQYGTKRKAPSTTSRQIRAERAALTPSEVRQNEQFKELQKTFLFIKWSKARDQGRLTASAYECRDFVTAFTDLVRAARNRPVVDLDPFRSLVKEHGISTDDLAHIARTLTQDPESQNRFVGRKLLLALSACGHEASTIQVMTSAHLQSKGNTKLVVLSPELVHARQHLNEMANAEKGSNYRAMVLEGKIANSLGKQDYAIEMWTKAVKVMLDLPPKARDPTLAVSPTRDDFELSSPWIELFLAHYERSKRISGEWDKALWAARVGCEQDDPASHYWYSLIVKRLDKNGQHQATSDWLYHITKAAASGHQVAAHELALFYTQTGWKYLNDEPPDHVKPTAFDSYPQSTISSVSTWFSNFLRFIGLSRDQSNPEDAIFRNAVFPRTAEARYLLAFQWLTIGLAAYYAPSYLLAARMHLEEKLWGRATVLDSFLQFSPNRYAYKSKAQADADPERKVEDRKIEEMYKGIDDRPNPLFSPEMAKRHLTEVFLAHKAHRFVIEQRDELRYHQSQGDAPITDDEGLKDSEIFRRSPWELRKWFRYPEVKESYEGQIESLISEARSICEQKGWTIVGPDGGLIYKARK